jgi:molybdenum cofactor synthesis domain-containing protein
MANPTAAMLVIGDEILSGRTRDSNMHFLAGELTRHGITLAEARVVSDDRAAIIAAVNALRGAFDNVFTSGGIGPTHDDITAEAIAGAFGVPITQRADAMALLAAHYDRAGMPFNEARQRMARIPDGATLIDNPISTARVWGAEYLSSNGGKRVAHPDRRRTIVKPIPAREPGRRRGGGPVWRAGRAIPGPVDGVVSVHAKRGFWHQFGDTRHGCGAN